MSKITSTQLIDECVDGLNYLSQKLASKEFTGGIIGPATSSLFLIVLLIHSEYNPKAPVKTDLLKEFYKYSSKSGLDDFEVIGCMRHSLAHNDFEFEITHLTFKGTKFGTLQVPYSEFSSLTNKMFQLYNTLKSN